MIGIKNIASYVPNQVLDNYAQATKFGLDKEFIDSKIGACELPIMDQGYDASDIAVNAVNALVAKCSDLSLNSIDVLFVVTQNGDSNGLPHTSAIVQDKLGLNTSIAAFDISLGCSGYVYGLYAMQGFMQATGLKNGVLVTADPYSKIVDRDDRTTSLLFGDAATATWLAYDPEWELGSVRFGTDGTGAQDLCKNADNKLYMNGRKVFNFAAANIAKHIKGLLEKSEISEEQVDAYVIHQGSAAIVNTIAKRFKGGEDKFIIDITNTGNTISSSIPLLLERYGFSKDWNTVVVSGFGVGLSWASAVLIRKD